MSAQFHPPQTTLRINRCLLALLLWAMSVPGVQAADGEPLNRLLSEHCVSCHGEKKAKGGLNLTKLLLEQPLIKNREQWNNVIEFVKNGEMPPEDEKQPSPKERSAILQHLDQALNDFDFSSLDDPGFEAARRLTNQEYNRTVSDLFGMELQVADRFPSDLTGASGFENSANTLFLQPALMERYIAAAERVVDTAIPEYQPGAAQSQSFRKIFTQLPSESISVSEASKTVLRRFLLRAYRRPATETELAQATRHFNANLRNPSDLPAFVEAIKQVLQATLISPKFLLRIEAGQTVAGAYRITDFELASRLSYFLWASMPDDTLFDLAGEDRLHEPEILKQQVSRMLQSPKADSLGRQFAAQWLGFRFMGNRVRLDPIDNPWCTDSLMTAMREESGLFFTSLVRENRSIDDLVAADYTYLNEELAGEIYGRNDIKGSEMRRVRLSNPNRGGILTHGSLMAITSNYKETSPIKRGNWILETVLGRPLPPPPPNAGAFKEEVEDNDSLTFREKVEMHSSDPSCRTCHSKIDPLGFSLENFDYFGRWRDSYRVRVVERNDEEALALTIAMRNLSVVELNERIADLDSGPEERAEIRERLAQLRRLSTQQLHTEITQNLPASRQNNLIELLEWLDIDFEGHEDDEFEAQLFEGVRALRQSNQNRLNARILRLDLEQEERKEIAEFVWRVRSATEAQIRDHLNDLEEDDGEEIFELLLTLGFVEEERDEENEIGELLYLIRALRDLSDEEFTRKIAATDLSPKERATVWSKATYFRNLKQRELEAFAEHGLREDFVVESLEILGEIELEIEEEDEEEETERRRRRFEQRPITAEATLPDGTPFQGPQGLKQVILTHHKMDLTRQLISKMLAYALGRQLEYFDEAAIRSILSQMESNNFQMHSLISGIVNSYPFQYKKNPESQASL